MTTKNELLEISKRMGIEGGADIPKKDLIEMIKKVEPIRLEFAKAALTGLVSNTTYFDPNQHHKMIREDLIFERAFTMADGMIKASKILEI